MEISSILKEEQIVIDLKANTQEEVLLKLSEKLLENKLILDQGAFLQATLEREQHATTGIGQGIAIPHGKSSTVQACAVAIGKTTKPIEWDSLDGQPVTLVFLLAIPEADQGDEHLKVLSELAQKMLDDELIAQLKQAEDAQTMIALLK